MRMIQAIIGCMALAGCMGEEWRPLESARPAPVNRCEIEEWYQAPGIREFKDFSIRQEGVLVKGFADCPSLTKISVRAYGPDGNLIGIGDDYIQAGVFSVFVETNALLVSTVKFRIEKR